MGEARRRGTFEERKAQAIAEGRVKPKRPEPESWWSWYKRQADPAFYWSRALRRLVERPGYEAPPL